ncbi:endonuclease/exonuclease/phosphatase family protein [Actinomadura parmotrematis]|uniref:endonuclease/exonuclease/phosphatase family protein n=1 Tax=Actinomadura parmotrematis TaxID=2864039 RepID=UPI0027E33D5D|nr:endonuclease/exonuclease/phosphatase family protein [Actinomadura parmotrematis]
MCGAGAIVAFAGAGAAIEKGSVPGLGDEERPAAEQVTLTALTWNVCGDVRPGCPLGARPAELARRISQQIAGTVVGGRRVGANAVLLQEVCSATVVAVGKTAAMHGWTWEFAASGGTRACANGQGRPGVALGVQGKIDNVESPALPAPAGHGRTALCGTVAAWQTRLCTVQLSGTAEDPSGAWRRKQTGRLAELAGGGRAIVGGDLTDAPTAAPLDVLYRDRAECDQGPRSRAAKTLQDAAGRAVAKSDYLFVPKDTAMSCEVPDQPVRSSDHRPVAALVSFR